MPPRQPKNANQAFPKGYWFRFFHGNDYTTSMASFHRSGVTMRLNNREIAFVICPNRLAVAVQENIAVGTMDAFDVTAFE